MKEEIILKGVSAAPGVALGKAFIIDKQDFVISSRALMDEEIPVELALFEEALLKAREEITVIKKKLEVEMGEKQAKIFDAHLLVLQDSSLIEEVEKRIKDEKLSAEFIFSDVIKKYIKVFDDMDDEYLKERASDVNDVGRRVLKNLMDEDKLHNIDHLKENLILIAHDLSPSDTASMYNKNVIAFATDIGGKTSHTAIMAKTLGIPAAVGLKDATLRVSNQDEIIVDGRKGLIIINPSEGTKKRYEEVKGRIDQMKDQYRDIKDLKAQTIDGHVISLYANIELPEEVPLILGAGAEGIGLYRTEFLYMNRTDLPTEEEQFDAYKKVAELMGERPVTIRSLDLGGDKFISSLEIPKDMYAFLGWRAIRFCLARPDIFKTQLRAILRASAFGNMRLMYPMITGPGELKEANGVLDEVKSELRAEGKTFNEDINVGVMIEVPSAAVIADLLAKEADFFSIGTNDLVQYTLAVDRVSEQTAELYDPGHPAVLRLINMAIEAGKNAKIDVSLCGEMCSEPALAFVLIGMGLTQLSMSPVSILQIKKMILGISYADAKQIVEKTLNLASGKEVEALSLQKLKNLVPSVMGEDD